MQALACGTGMECPCLPLRHLLCSQEDVPRSLVQRGPEMSINPLGGSLHELLYCKSPSFSCPLTGVPRVAGELTLHSQLSIAGRVLTSYCVQLTLIKQISKNYSLHPLQKGLAQFCVVAAGAVLIGCLSRAASWHGLLREQGDTEHLY